MKNFEATGSTVNNNQTGWPRSSKSDETDKPNRSVKNPKLKRQRPLYSPKVTVWAVITSRGVLDTFFENKRGRPDLTPADVFVQGLS